MEGFQGTAARKNSPVHHLADRGAAPSCVVIPGALPGAGQRQGHARPHAGDVPAQASRPTARISSPMRRWRLPRKTRGARGKNREHRDTGKWAGIREEGARVPHLAGPSPSRCLCSAEGADPAGPGARKPPRPGRSSLASNRFPRVPRPGPRRYGPFPGRGTPVLAWPRGGGQQGRVGGGCGWMPVADRGAGKAVAGGNTADSPRHDRVMACASGSRQPLVSVTWTLLAPEWADGGRRTAPKFGGR